LADVALALSDKLTQLNRMPWVIEDCRALAHPDLYEPDLSKSWQRLRGIAQLPPPSRARAKAIAIWRERVARDRDLPRAWILDDAALFAIAHAAPETAAALDAVKPLNERFAASLLEALRAAAQVEPTDLEPAQDLRPTAEQKALIERLNKVVDGRAKELQISAEVLAPRGEIKAIALGARDSLAFQGWRAGQIGDALREALRTMV
jgi:ribonuclease D